MTESYDKINLLYNGKHCGTGRLKFTEEGFGWKNINTSQIYTIKYSEIISKIVLKNINLLIFKIILENSSSFIFESINSDFFKMLSATWLKYCSERLELKTQATGGPNWSNTIELDEGILFRRDEQLFFNINMNQLVNCSLISKNELMFETSNEGSDILTEVKIFVPDILSKDNNSVTSSASDLYSQIKSKTTTNEMSDLKPLLTLYNLSCLLPRGRFDLELYSEFFQIRGKSFDYKVSFSNVSKIFFLSLTEEENPSQYYLLFALKSPVKHGQTQYHSILFMIDLEQIKLEDEKEGESQDLEKLLGSLSSQKIIKIGSFSSIKREPFLKCIYKASEGHLFVLDRNFIFLPKPVIITSFEDIDNIEIALTGTSLHKNFEIKLSLHRGEKIGYSNINGENLDIFLNYLKNKKIPFNIEEENEKRRTYYDIDSSSASEDQSKHSKMDEETSTDSSYEEESEDQN